MEKNPKGFARVVARMREGKVLKGYLEKCVLTSSPSSSLAPEDSLPDEFPLRIDGSDLPVKVRRDSLKALFFVKTFDGDKKYNEIKFFEKNPAIKGLWARVTFYDHESLEGIISNSIHFLVGCGFHLQPPDPRSNNESLYVVKSSLVDFRVLGVKMDF